MKIVSLNVNGLRAAVRRGFIDWVKRLDADVVCLQEIKVSNYELSFDLVYLNEYFF